MFGKAIITFALCGLATHAVARPVSYAGGWTLIEETDRQATTGILHYTPDATYSVGARIEWDRRDDVLFTGVQGTWLAKRWFGEDYQANLYFWGAAGLAKGVNDNPGDTRAGVQLGLMSDWETRRWFLSYRASMRDFGTLDRSAMQAARVGWAPYEGDTGDLHTWLMVELDQRSELPEPVGVTPLVRFFYGPAMIEAGWSVTDDEPLINFQYRF
jgi:hypothetical protein